MARPRALHYSASRGKNGSAQHSGPKYLSDAKTTLGTFLNIQQQPRVDRHKQTSFQFSAMDGELSTLV